MTPLHLAAQRGYSRIIECLVGLGAAVNAKDSNNNTALHLVLSQSELFVQTTEKKSSTYADEGASYIDQVCLENALHGGKRSKPASYLSFVIVFAHGT